MAEYPRLLIRTGNNQSSPYAMALSGALMGILGQEIHDVPGVVEALNATEVKPPEGGAWTEAVFLSEMKRLGEGPQPGPGPAPAPRF